MNNIVLEFCMLQAQLATLHLINLVGLGQLVNFLFKQSIIFFSIDDEENKSFAFVFSIKFIGVA